MQFTVSKTYSSTVALAKSWSASSVMECHIGVNLEICLRGTIMVK